MSNLNISSDSYAVQRAIKLVGADTVSKLNEFYIQSSKLENDYKPYALQLIEQTLRVNSSGETRKALRNLLMELGFKRQNTYVMIGAQELVNSLAAQKSDATDWVKSLPVSTSHVLGGCDEDTFNKIWAKDSEWGQKPISRREVLALKDKYEKPKKCQPVDNSTPNDLMTQKSKRKLIEAQKLLQEFPSLVSQIEQVINADVSDWSTYGYSMGKQIASDAV